MLSGVSVSSTNAAASLAHLATTRDATARSKPKPHAARANAGQSVLASFAPMEPCVPPRVSCVVAAAVTTSAATTETTAAMQGGAAPTKASERASPLRRALRAALGENDSRPPSSAAAAHRLHTLLFAIAESNSELPSNPRSFSSANERSMSFSVLSRNPKSLNPGLSSGKSIFLALSLPGEASPKFPKLACPGRGSDPPRTGTWPTGLDAAT